jgi:hypothetical protein
VARPGHLASRFFGSLLPIGPKPADAAWALAHLNAGEQAVWSRMSKVDRRHAAGVARRAALALGDQATTEVVAAALLHDSGKVECRLGTFGRVLATVAAMAAGRERAELWSHGRGLARRIGLYLRHAELGAALLASTGSHPLTSSWAGEHHLPEGRWTVPLDVGRALKAADDD